MQSGLGGDIDSATQFCIEVGNQSPGEEGGTGRTSFDEKIEITVGPGVAAGEGSEYANASDAMLFGDGDYGVALVFTEFVQRRGHALIIEEGVPMVWNGTPITRSGDIDLELYVAVLVTPGPVGLLVFGFERCKIGILAVILFHPDPIGSVFVAVPLMIVVMRRIVIRRMFLGHDCSGNDKHCAHQRSL